MVDIPPQSAIKKEITALYAEIRRQEKRINVLAEALEFYSRHGREWRQFKLGTNNKSAQILYDDAGEVARGALYR